MTHMRLAGAIVGVALALAGAPALATRSAEAPAAPAAPPLSFEAFRDRLLGALRAAHPGRPVALKDERTATVGAGDDMSTLALDNAYQQYLDSEDADLTIGRWVRVFAATDPDTVAPVERNRLVVFARPVSAADLDQLGVVHAPLGGDLAALLAWDSAEALRYATRDEIARLGLDEAAAFALARANVAKRIGEIGRAPRDGPIPALVGAESGLASGLLADGSMCGPDRPSGRPSGVRVYLFRRDMFALADPADPGAVGALRAFASWSRTQPDAYSATPLACEGGRWRASD
jgi:hypothetical protein